MILFLSFTVVLFINLQNNSEVGNQFSTNLEDVTNVKDNVKGLEELLELVGLTGSDFDDEWDDEMGRKS